MVIGRRDAVSLPWPIHTIDFEASSLDDGTYPIEVGIARWVAPTSDIETWSTLIRPLANWERYGSWSPKAEAVHGVPREQLAQGLGPNEAMARLNAIVESNFAYCDGGDFDRHWFGMLQHAAGQSASFHLASFDDLKLRLDHSGQFRLQTWLDDTPTPHRAGPDAQRLLMSLARGLGINSCGVVAIIPQVGSGKESDGPANDSPS